VKRGRIAGRLREILQGFDVFMTFLKIQEAERAVEPLPMNLPRQGFEMFNVVGQQELNPSPLIPLPAWRGEGSQKDGLTLWSRSRHESACARRLTKRSHSFW
jgi:hypothetical protein